MHPRGLQVLRETVDPLALTRPHHAAQHTARAAVPRAESARAQRSNGAKERWRETERVAAVKQRLKGDLATQLAQLGEGREGRGDEAAEEQAG